MSHKSFVLLRFRKRDQISARSVDKHLYISMNSLVRRISDSTFDHFNLLPSNKQPRRGPELIDLGFPKQCTRSHQSWFSADWPPLTASAEQIFAQPYFPSFNQKKLFNIFELRSKEKRLGKRSNISWHASRRFVQITSKLYYFKIAFTFCLTKNSKRQARSSLQISLGGRSRRVTSCCEHFDLDLHRKWLVGSKRGRAAASYF